MSEAYALRAPRAGRIASRVTRRVVGFFLLCFALGLTTCQAFDTARAADGGIKIYSSVPFVIVRSPVSLSL